MGSDLNPWHLTLLDPPLTKSGGPGGSPVEGVGETAEGKEEMKIKALETEYAGCRFRSRLEARWAMFFDRMRIKWDYEPDAFATSMGNYLPDFSIRIPQPEAHGHGEPHAQWFEVKPDEFDTDPRHRALAVESGQPVIVARGMPRSYLAQLTEETRVTRAPLVAYGLEDDPIAVAFFENKDWDVFPRDESEETFCGLGDNRIWEQGSHDELTLAIVRHHHEAPGLPGYTTWAPHRSEGIDRAYAAARSARFGT